MGDGMPDIERSSVDRTKPLRIAQASSVAWIDKDGGYHWGRLYVQPDGTVRFELESDDAH
jgi:hypothetical protein